MYIVALDIHLQVQVCQLREVSNKNNNAELKLFLEVDYGLVPSSTLLLIAMDYSPLLTFVFWFFTLPLTCLIYQDFIPGPPPDKSKDDILLFFKLYDPEKEELR